MFYYIYFIIPFLLLTILPLAITVTNSHCDGEVTVLTEKVGSKKFQIKTVPIFNNIPNNNKRSTSNHHYYPQNQQKKSDTVTHQRKKQ